MIKYASANIRVGNSTEIPMNARIIPATLKLFNGDSEITSDWYQTKGIYFLLERDDQFIRLSNLDTISFDECGAAGATTVDRLHVRFENGDNFIIGMPSPALVEIGNTMSFSAKSLTFTVDLTSVRVLNVVKHHGYTP